MASETTSEKKETKNSTWDSFEGFASFLGQWAWLILIIESAIFIMWGIFGLAWVGVWGSAAAQAGATSSAADIVFSTFYYVWYIIGGIATIIITLIFIKPGFSAKWADKDYDYLLNDVIEMGNARIPKMLILGIVIECLLQFWGGLVVLIPLFLLIFFGPKEYNWKVK